MSEIYRITLTMEYLTNEKNIIVLEKIKVYLTKKDKDNVIIAEIENKFEDCDIAVRSVMEVYKKK